MAARAGEGYVLLVKKLYGLFLIILGCLLTAAGVSSDSMGLTAFGILAFDCRRNSLGSQDRSA